MSSIIRSLARNRAKQNMKKSGMVKICKGNFFAKNWRYYVVSSKRRTR